LDPEERRHAPDDTAKESPIPLPTPSHHALQFLKAALNVVVAEVQALDDPKDLTRESPAQIGLYPHRDLDSQTSSKRPGVLNSCYPYPRLGGTVLRETTYPRERIFMPSCNI
jgi:hypothetical protein